MTRRQILFASACLGLVCSVVLSREGSAAVRAEPDQETVCSTLTSCPNRQTQVCAEVRLNPGGAGVVYTCYQPIVE